MCVVVVEAVDPAGDGQLEPRVPAAGCRLRGDIGEPRVCEDGFGLAVAQDVGDLVGGDVPVDRSQPYAAALGALNPLDELRPVRAEQRDAVTGPDARVSQDACDLVGPRVELGE